MADKKYSAVDKLFKVPETDRIAAETRSASDALGAASRAEAEAKSAEVARQAQSDDGSALRQMKSDLVADELHAANEAKARASAKVQAALDDKFGGPTIAEQESQARFIDTERAEIQRKATKTSKGLMVGPLSSIAMAFFRQRKE